MIIIILHSTLDVTTQLVGGLCYFRCCATRGSVIEIIIADLLDSALVIVVLDFNIIGCSSGVALPETAVVVAPFYFGWKCMPCLMVVMVQAFNHVLTLNIAK